MFHDFPYTDFHELNLDFLMRQCGSGLGLRLAIEGDYLRLVNAKNEVVSQVNVHYADTALSDVNGKPIKTYICDVQSSGTAIVFTNGQNEMTTITVPYSTKAKEDINGRDLEDYVYSVQVAGDTLRVTKGDMTIADITIPYAVSATGDEDGKVISTYAAELTVDGDHVVLRDAKGRVLNSITVPYATEASHADSADTADEAAHADKADSALDADHADLADLATVATDCTNAIQSVSISGNTVVLTTYGGQINTLTIPYAIKAQKDDAGNTIKTTYVASVSQDPVTGEISFYDATGTVITSLVPTASKATYDSYDNEIADYIKTIVVSSNSDYVTVTHGDGAVNTIQINYSTHAWKDTNENVIKNTYCRLLTMETDAQTGDSVLVGWNGDNPTAEIFRLRVRAISSYIVIDLSSPDNGVYGTYTPTNIVGDPINNKESCVLIDSNTGRAWTRTFVSATTATFSTDLVINDATLKQVGRQTWDYNSNTGKVVENAVWTASINDSVTTPDSTEDLESITVDYFGTTIKYEAKAGAGRIIFNTTSGTTIPYSWNTGSRAVTAKDEVGNTLTPAEVKAKIEAGAAIQVIATCTSSDPNLAGAYVPNDVRLVYGWEVSEQKPTLVGIDCYFMSNAKDDTYFDEGRRLFITTSVTGTVYKVNAKKIEDLGNVNLSDLSSGDVLAYNGTDWVNSARLLSSLSDVRDISPSNGDILVYNGFYNQWEASAVESNALVVGITVNTPLNDMLHNTSHSYTLDTDMEYVYTSLAAGKTVILDDGQGNRGNIATIVGMGDSTYDGAIAMGGSAQSGIRYFTLTLPNGGNTGNITCKIVPF